MEVFNDLQLNDGRMVGYLNLPESLKVVAEFDLEEHDHPEPSDFAELISTATSWATGLNAATFEILKKQIAKELTDAAYGGAGYQVSESDYADLETSLLVERLCFFPDNIVLIIFEAKKEYPDMDIYCQLDNSYQIEDISVEERN
ncbi:hypothetical protein SAMN05428949_5541 [Chitinophaga sp. YR627]|uniref:hypothetical protein n=1 Tax=Chitinophaga sp. YR627 TaxID=1881041 RepID=UPI0008E6C79E|nr:hypothetical protein [Chitinophaga sp. YR627]SFO51986.1 hypothetical protein SAMN05428949_5541 [Chitinophaga sp. YR627]